MATAQINIKYIIYTECMKNVTATENKSTHSVSYNKFLLPILFIVFIRKRARAGQITQKLYWWIVGGCIRLVLIYVRAVA